MADYNLVDWLRWRATHQPDQTAYTFLLNGETPTARLTYDELDQQARAIAATLQKRLAIGDRAVLLYPAGLEFIAAFFGCLYAGIVAIPAPFPDPVRLKHTLPRLQAIIKDAQAAIILGNLRQIAQIHDSDPLFEVEEEDTHWIVDSITCRSLAEKWQPLSFNNSHHLAYLQYTSGSTSMPKGVMVSHQNLVHHCQNLQQAWQYTSDSLGLTWMPHFHDYGLVDGIIQPLYSGIPALIMSPVAFYMRPLRWLQAISHYRITHSQGPNFAYEHCLERIKPVSASSLNLQCWRTASNGSEPVRQETLERFVARFHPYGFRREAFYPAYGLAEATLLVSTKPHHKPPRICLVLAEALEQGQVIEAAPTEVIDRVHSIVSCGSAIAETTLRIVNPTTLTPCTVGEIGEIWVSAPGVALGYWNKPEATRNTFRAYIQGNNEGPFLRTGDLGFLKDNELYITGRIKDLILIRGRNHYPQDIEKSVEQSHPALRVGFSAAFSIEVREEEVLVVVQEVARSYLKTLDLSDVVGNIRAAVSEQHELQIFEIALVMPGSIPKTSSGKIQRSVCREQFLNGTLSRYG